MSHDDTVGERAPECLSKDVRVSKDGSRQGLSKRPLFEEAAQEGGLLGMGADCCTTSEAGPPGYSVAMRPAR